MRKSEGVLNADEAETKFSTVTTEQVTVASTPFLPPAKRANAPPSGEPQHSPAVVVKVSKRRRPRRREVLRRRRAKAYFFRTYYAKNKKVLWSVKNINTLWNACRTVVIGSVVIFLGLAMTVIGYFDRELTTSFATNSTLGTTITVVDNSLRYKLKSMQYIGPIFMGVGMFLLIIACVITLESRDRHAQIIQEECSRNSSKRQSIRPVKTATTLPESITRTTMLPPSDSLRKRIDTDASGVCSEDNNDGYQESRNSKKCQNKSSLVGQQGRFSEDKRHPAGSEERIKASTKTELQKSASCDANCDKAEKTFVIEGEIYHPPFVDVQHFSVSANTNRNNNSKNDDNRPITARSHTSHGSSSSAMDLPRLYRPSPKGAAPLVRVDSLVELSSLLNTPAVSINASPNVGRRKEEEHNKKLVEGLD